MRNVQTADWEVYGREDGVTKVNVDYKHKKTKVTYNAERTNIENIKTAIANVGYDADDITANEESYQKLPKCCKKPEDGGGMEKWRDAWGALFEIASRLTKRDYIQDTLLQTELSWRLGAKESPDSIEQCTGE